MPLGKKSQYPSGSHATSLQCHVASTLSKVNPVRIMNFPSTTSANIPILLGSLIFMQEVGRCIFHKRTTPTFVFPKMSLIRKQSRNFFLASHPAGSLGSSIIHITDTLRTDATLVLYIVLFRPLLSLSLFLIGYVNSEVTNSFFNCGKNSALVVNRFRHL